MVYDSEKAKEKYQQNKDKYKERNAKYYKENRDKHIKHIQKYNSKLRLNIINRYGGKCECCGEDRIEFLAIDHRHGREEDHEKKVNGINLLYKIIRENYPNTYRILCHNCNCALSNYGYCPHHPEKTVNYPDKRKHI